MSPFVKAKANLCLIFFEADDLLTPFGLTETTKNPVRCNYCAQTCNRSRENLITKWRERSAFWKWLAPWVQDALQLAPVCAWPALAAASRQGPIADGRLRERSLFSSNCHGLAKAQTF